MKSLDDTIELRYQSAYINSKRAVDTMSHRGCGYNILSSSQYPLRFMCNKLKRNQSHIFNLSVTCVPEDGKPRPSHMEAKSSSIGHAVFRCSSEPRCTREDGKTASSQVLEGVSRGIAWQLQAPDSTALKIVLLKVVKQSRKREADHNF